MSDVGILSISCRNGDVNDLVVSSIDAECCKCGRIRPLVNVRCRSCAECFVLALSRTFASNLRSKCIVVWPRPLALYIPGDIYSVSLLHLLLTRNLRRFYKSNRRLAKVGNSPTEGSGGDFTELLQRLIDGHDLTTRLIFAIDGLDGCGSVVDASGYVDNGTALGGSFQLPVEPLAVETADSIPTDFHQRGSNFISSVFSFLDSLLETGLPSTSTPPLTLDDAIVGFWSVSSLNIAYIRPCFFLHVAKDSCDDSCTTLARRLTQAYTQSDDSRYYATLLVRRWNFIALTKWLKAVKGVDIGALATADVMEDAVTNVIFNTCIGASSRIPYTANFVEQLLVDKGGEGGGDVLQWYRPLVTLSRLEIEFYWKLQVADCGNTSPSCFGEYAGAWKSQGVQGTALETFKTCDAGKTTSNAFTRPKSVPYTTRATNSCNSITAAVHSLLDAIEKAAEKPLEENGGGCSVIGGVPGGQPFRNTERVQGGALIAFNASRESRAAPLNPEKVVNSSVTTTNANDATVKSGINNTLCNIVRVTNKLVDPPSVTVDGCKNPLTCKACLYRIGSSEFKTFASFASPVFCYGCKFLSRRYDSLALLFDSLGMCT